MRDIKDIHDFFLNGSSSRLFRVPLPSHFGTEIELARKVGMTRGALFLYFIFYA